MAQITAEQRKKYLKNKGAYCPLCGSNNITAGSVDMDGDNAWVEVDCEDCETVWRDVYKLVDIEDVPTYE